MSEEPIIDRHVAFARALVSLCREHGVGTIVVDHFTLTASKLFFDAEQYNSTRVAVSWTQGRHGDEGRISLRAQAGISINERAEDQP